MPLTKKYIKSSIAIFFGISTIVIFLSEKYGFGMIDHYCVQGSQLFNLSLDKFGISFCSLIVFAGEVLAVWAILFIIVALLDLLTAPIRYIINRRKNRVRAVKNMFYD